MKKTGVLLLLIVFLVSFALAQNGSNASQTPDSPTTDGVSKAYQCVEDLVDGKAKADFSLEEAIFSTLALGSDSKVLERIDDLGTGECWPSSSCEIKETAQVLLAKDRIGQNTDEIESWLSSKNQSAKDLRWLLQIVIDGNGASQCTISYDGSSSTIRILDDMTLQGSGGSCLNVDSSGYWLEVRDSCTGTEFTVSCENDFLASLLYQKSGSDLIFVSPTTHSAASLGTTTEKINSVCLGLGSNCDYEGTLWGALALDKAGIDVKNYLPYLLALAEDNERFFPASFLHILTGSDDQYSRVIQKQKNNQYWQESSTTSARFHDTALGMLSLQGTSAAELTNAKNYLLGIQTAQGCWNNDNLRDSAFLLYSGWPKAVSSSGGSTGGGISCEGSGNFCVSSLFSCVNDAGGFVVNSGSCSVGVCCTQPIVLDSCAVSGGSVCAASQECSGSSVPSSGGSCCLGTCQNIVSQDNSCELAGGFCDTSCQPGERQDSSLSCDSPGAICCIADSDSGGGINIWVWIIILVVLIALVVLGIIFRRKIQLMFFKLGGKRKSSRGGRGGPPSPPARMSRPMPFRRPQMRGVSPPPRPRRESSKADKELEETLKKLKEIGK